jgi:hypothetical protein
MRHPAYRRLSIWILEYLYIHMPPRRRGGYKRESDNSVRSSVRHSERMSHFPQGVIPVSELVRRDGVYEIYGTDERGPYFLVPDGLDTSLSLGELPLAKANRRKGLRQDDAAIGAAIARYTSLLDPKYPPHATHILVLGDRATPGSPYAPTNTVVDGALWIEAARRVGLPQVPAHLVVPPADVPLEMVWLYFNRRHGFAYADADRDAILRAFAAKCRTTRQFTAAAKFAQEIALWTGLPVRVIHRATVAIFTKRTQADREETVQMFRNGRRVGEIAATQGLSHQAVTKDLKRAGVVQSPNGKAPTAAQRPAPPWPSPHLSPTADARQAAAMLEEGLAQIKPGLIGVINQLHLLTSSNGDGQSEAEAFSLAESLTVADVVDDLWIALVEFYAKSRVYADPEKASRDAKPVVGLADYIMTTLREHRPRLAEQLSARAQALLPLVG